MSPINVFALPAFPHPAFRFARLPLLKKFAVLATFAAFSAMLLSPCVAQTSDAMPKYKINLPPSANLSYSITAKQSGIALNGEAQLRWTQGSGKYGVIAESSAMLFGKFLEEKSEGAIDANGLAPQAFTEKRMRKEPTTATFDRQAGKISFTDSKETYPIRGGEQDRTSVIWQLIGAARGAPEKFKPGSNWNFFVVGQRDAEPWIFQVVNQEKITTPQGQQNTWHLLRKPPANSKGQRLDIWLAPALESYPVKLRFTEGNDDTIEQVLEKIEKK
ncbi:MAG: putative PROLIN-rich signal peptide protein [Herminiimonas sp.]|nr:putative PROLIN-rich signal peptide protein [Herminiimonas sp.]